MTRVDRFVGAMLIIGTALSFLSVALSFIASHPTWWGILLGLGTISGGFMACASIWRDRL